MFNIKHKKKRKTKVSSNYPSPLPHLHSLHLAPAPWMVSLHQIVGVRTRLTVAFFAASSVWWATKKSILLLSASISLRTLKYSFTWTFCLTRGALWCGWSIRCWACFSPPAIYPAIIPMMVFILGSLPIGTSHLKHNLVIKKGKPKMC